MKLTNQFICMLNFFKTDHPFNLVGSLVVIPGCTDDNFDEFSQEFSCNE